LQFQNIWELLNQSRNKIALINIREFHPVNNDSKQTLPFPLASAIGSDFKPKSFCLYQNYPNPFNPTTSITFDLPEECWVYLKIYDLSGREIRNLMSAFNHSGNYRIFWDGLDDSGKSVASGIYVYRIQA
jgi:hypothetical protein